MNTSGGQQQRAAETVPARERSSDGSCNITSNQRWFPFYPTSPPFVPPAIICLIWRSFICNAVAAAASSSMWSWNPSCGCNRDQNREHTSLQTLGSTIVPLARRKYKRMGVLVVGGFYSKPTPPSTKMLHCWWRPDGDVSSLQQSWRRRVGAVSISSMSISSMNVSQQLENGVSSSGYSRNCSQKPHLVQKTFPQRFLDQTPLKKNNSLDDTWRVVKFGVPFSKNLKARKLPENIFYVCSLKWWRGLILKKRQKNK